MAFTLPFKNMPRNGQVRTLIYEEDGVWYGVALEFNLVESGDSPQEVMVLLHEAMAGYIHTVNTKKISMSVLNQKADGFFDMLWNADQEDRGRKQKVYNTGVQQLAAFA